MGRRLIIEGNFILVALISIVIWLIYRIYSSIRNKKINIFREIVLFIFFVYFLFLLLLTMFKGGRIEFSNQFNSYMYREQGLLVTTKSNYKYIGSKCTRDRW